MQNNAIKKSLGIILLFITAIVWGASFIAQSDGMKVIEGFTYNGIRTIMGAISLIPILIIKSSKLNTHNSYKKKTLFNKKTIIFGSLLGVILCIATNFQQFAFNYSTSGKIAFVTAVYMFLVPIISLLIFKKRINFIVWISVIVGFIGLFLLCVNPSDILSLNQGDFLAFCGAIFFAIHILVIENSDSLDGIALSFLQFAVSGIISIILMFIFEKPDITAIFGVKWALLYSGVMSCGVAYTCQILGQKHVEPTIASLIMSLESVFAVITAALLRNEIPSTKEWIGCIVMFLAILLSQSTDIIKKRHTSVIQK